MKSYKIWLVIVLVLLAINSAVLAVIWFHKRPVILQAAHNKELPHMEPKDVLINTLALTPRQQDLYTVMRNKHMLLTRKLNNENRALKDSLFANIKATKVDSTLINNITKHISNNQTQIDQATLYHFRELRSILTPNQQIKFDDIIAQVLQMMGRPGPAGNEQAGKPAAQGDGNNFGPPPNQTHQGRNNRNHHMPPPDRRPPPGADGFPPDGPPPNGMPPDGPPPGRPPMQ